MRLKERSCEPLGSFQRYVPGKAVRHDNVSVRREQLRALHEAGKPDGTVRRELLCRGPQLLPSLAELGADIEDFDLRF